MPKRLIIDTNLLLLLIIGAVEEGKHIRNSKRLGAFDRSDYDIVLKYITTFDGVFITPYIATEVSNLIDLNGHAKILAFEVARKLFSVFKQIDVDISADCESQHFLEFGITDTSIIGLAKSYYILTNDYRMLNPLYENSPNTIIPYNAILNLI